MGSPLPQASQNCDAEWQGARATALPEGFRPRGEQIPKPPRQACMEREKASKKGLEEWEEVILEGRVWRGGSAWRLGWGGEAGGGVG